MTPSKRVLLPISGQSRRVIPIRRSRHPPFGHRHRLPQIGAAALARQSSDACGPDQWLRCRQLERFLVGVERIVRANSAYCVLLYNPPSRRRDGKFHRIDVRTSRPGLTVLARKGYVALRTNTRPARSTNKDISPTLLSALNNAVPSGGLTMRLFAVRSRGRPPAARSSWDSIARSRACHG